MARRLSDAEWMTRYAQRAGSQAEVARQLGVSRGLVSRIIKGERSGERFREQAVRGARGRPVVAPEPAPRTPRRVRQPARRPTSDGGSRVATGSPRVAGREVRRSVDRGRPPRAITVTVRGVPRGSGTPERGTAGGTRTRGPRPGWSGSLTIRDLTAAELDALSGAGDDSAVMALLRDRNGWIGDGGRLSRITFED